MKRVFFSMLLSVAVMASCQCNRTAQVEIIECSAFRTTIEGEQVGLYTLKNSHGTTMQVTNYGARVVSLWCSDRDGNFADIVMGYDNIDKYINNPGERFLGAAIGRYGNRIADGKFTLDGVDYMLSKYNNGQCLHGGDVGFDRVVWQVKEYDDSSIVFSYLSKDMEEGFPGNLQVEMSYRLSEENEFIVEYSATTDKATPVNLTHHSFFNLKGEGEGTINNHVLTIAADKFTPVDEWLIPTGEIASVEGSVFDFREGKNIGNDLDKQETQFEYCKGYDHNFVLNRKSENELEFAASVYEPTSGRYMEVWTTEPALQFYGGNFFDGKIIGKRGKSHDFRGSFALETQHYPDSPNQPQFPSTILNPGETYTHTCVYRFKTISLR